MFRHVISKEKILKGMLSVTKVSFSFYGRCKLREIHFKTIFKCPKKLDSKQT